MCITTAITDTCTQPNQNRMKTGCVSPRPLQTRVHNPTKIEWKPDMYRHGHYRHVYTTQPKWNENRMCIATVITDTCTQSNQNKMKTRCVSHSQKWWVFCSFAYPRWRRRNVCNFHMIYIHDIIHNCMCVILWTWKWYIESSWIKWNKMNENN